MINDIINGISIALNGEFGDRYRIYANDIQQGLREPCFFISCIRPSSRPRRGKRYFRDHRFCIQYFPENEHTARQECGDVADRLFLCLEYITVDGSLVRGIQMSSESADGILSFFVNYNISVKAVEEGLPFMEELDIEEFTKEERQGEREWL